MAPASKLRNNRAAAKQQMLRNIENEKFDPANADPLSKEDTQMLIDHMQAKLDNQIKILLAEKENQRNKLKQLFDSGMAKMSKATRQMTIAEFDAANDCDIVAIVCKTKESLTESAAAPKSAASSAAVYETPAMSRRNKHVDPTPPRTVRRGEQIMSQNGSPIDLYEEGTLVATVTKGRREPSFDIHVGQGEFININNAEQIKAASPAKKAAVQEHLQLLRNKIDQLIGGFEDI